MLLIAVLLLATITLAPIVIALTMAFAPAPLSPLRRTYAEPDEQPLALAVLVAFRAPPV